MKQILSSCLATLFLIAIVSAQTAETTRSPNPVYAPLANAPRKAAARPNPLQDNPNSAAGGGKLFALHCAECHGEMAEGGKKAPSLLADEVQHSTPGALFWLLTNGVVRRGMPVWSKLPEPQRWQLVSYIKSLNPKPDTGAEKPSKESNSASGTSAPE